MATLEFTAWQGWCLRSCIRKQTLASRLLEVEVIPGITAAQAAASLLGAPLANDFAVLSLSDLLKARETIEGRLEALGGC